MEGTARIILKKKNFLPIETSGEADVLAVDFNEDNKSNYAELQKKQFIKHGVRPREIIPPTTFPEDHRQKKTLIEEQIAQKKINLNESDTKQISVGKSNRVTRTFKALKKTPTQTTNDTILENVKSSAFRPKFNSKLPNENNSRAYAHIADPLRMTKMDRRIPGNVPCQIHDNIEVVKQNLKINDDHFETNHARQPDKFAFSGIDKNIERNDLKSSDVSDGKNKKVPKQVNIFKKIDVQTLPAAPGDIKKML